VTTFPAEPRLEVRIGYRGDLAELIRASLANRPQAEFEKAVVGDYVRAFPGAREVGEMQVQEDPTNNALTLLLQFSLPDYWRYPDQQRLAGNFWLVSAMSALRPTSQAPRTRPLRIAYPGIYRESFAVAFPEDVYSKPSSSRFDEQNKFFSYHLHQEALSRENRVTAELQLPKSQVETADWPDYMAQVTKVWPHLGGTVFVPTIDPVHFDKLRSDGQALTEDMRKGKVKVKTATQIKAQMTVLFMNAQIDGGRLAPKLLAQALVQRAEQYDHLGSYDRARADLQTATELDPSYAEGHAALAVNAMLAGRDEQVEEEVSKALALAPNDVAPRYTLLFSSYQRGLYQQARDEALELLANPAEVDRSYAAVWLYLASRRMGESGEKAVEGHLASGANPAWPFPVVQLLTGKIDMGQAEKAASDNGQPNAEKMCELYYYAAELALINGDRGKARKFLRSSLETGVVEFNEYAFAQRGLGRLESAR